MPTVRASLSAIALMIVTMAGCGGDVSPAGERTPAPATEAAPVTAPPASATAPPVATTSPAAAPTQRPSSPPAKPRRTTDNSQRDYSCDMASDGVPVCEGRVPASVGKYRTPRQEIDRQRRAESDAALRACMEQTGMTRDECIADAAAGNAS